MSKEVDLVFCSWSAWGSEKGSRRGRGELAPCRRLVITRYSIFWDRQVTQAPTMTTVLLLYTYAAPSIVHLYYMEYKRSKITALMSKRVTHVKPKASHGRRDATQWRRYTRLPSNGFRSREGRHCTSRGVRLTSLRPVYYSILRSTILSQYDNFIKVKDTTVVCTCFTCHNTAHSCATRGLHAYEVNRVL